MPPERITDEDEEYESSQDSDFAPDDAPEAASSSSDSEDGAGEAAGKRRRPIKDARAEGAQDYDNSGDEAIIEKGRKRQKRAKAKGEAVDDEGGEGGLIKTRRQRAAEYVPTTGRNGNQAHQALLTKYQKRRAQICRDRGARDGRCRCHLGRDDGGGILGIKTT